MRVLNQRGVAAKIGKSISTLYRIRRRDPRFPRPLRLNGERSHPDWPEEAIDVWLATCAAESST